jgi:hypothetical protein
VIEQVLPAVMAGLGPTRAAMTVWEDYANPTLTR